MGKSLCALPSLGGLVMVNKEIIWFHVLLLAFLWMAGGTWNKNIRRIGVPIFLCSMYWAFFPFHWWFFIFGILQYIVLTLPFTVGDGDVRSWWQFAWIWIAGYLIGLPVLIPAVFFGKYQYGFILPLISFFVQGIFGTFSNLPTTRRWFPWKLVEFLIGSSIGTIHALFITCA